ncbi:MAG TPA: hypothetical protein DDW84_01075 [Phycisphaerales bacterium]|nr:MAG: hypothetical protein A2Y13_12605 [Planctomycetes bacterium GWC2_45_44]HBG77429.1 hypothetical protein [Phycisphaerales bacterium]HBR20599.1 hypothetical protein [Phycisphaerales bacterium]
MAIPRVFISSTCYDLSEVRDTLVTFINSFGFEAALSERGDIFYHPDLHTHECCIREITNCHLLVLIIGGRFGGTYNADTNKSIVNAEYEAARQLNIPVFTFVKKNVLNDHAVYERNKSNKADIVYPSIEKNEYAKHIFEFINQVRRSPVNNGLFDFQFSRDIEELLKKQWAGMFYELLADRASKAKLESANQTLSQLNTMSKKIEELVENIYRRVDETQADTVIEALDRKAEVLSFFRKIENIVGHSIIFEVEIDEIMKIPLNQSWYDWLAKVPGFEIIKDVDIHGANKTKANMLAHLESKRIIAPISGDLLNEDKKENEECRRKFESFKHFNEEERRKILESIALPF